MSPSRPGLDDLLRALPSLDRGELFALAAEHGQDPPGHAAAWVVARQVAERDGLAGEVDHLRADIVSWATNLGAITGQEAGTGTADLLLTDARRQAGTAVIDAAVALLLGDRLIEPYRSVLLGPWLRVRGFDADGTE